VKLWCRWCDAWVLSKEVGQLSRTGGRGNLEGAL